MHYAWEKRFIQKNIFTQLTGINLHKNKKNKQK